ncbi:MAG: hypothetical protein PHN64_09190 [Desulfovibrionaceae bacterium]|nr:hypothetical protein [Desulfovibrionaceae bacterium]
MLKKLSCTLGRSEKAPQGNHYLAGKAAPASKGSPVGRGGESCPPQAAPEDTAQSQAAAAEPAQKKEKKKTSWVFCPTYSRIILSLVLFLCSTLWIFVMGFWIGTNQNPNETVQAFTGMNKEEKATTPSAEATKQPQAKPETNTAAEPKALAEKDRAKPAQTAQGKAQNTAKAESPAKKAEEKKPAAPNSPQYNYVFQVATFKATEEDNVAALRAKLEAENLRVQVKGKQLRQVLVLVRGTEADAANVHALCAKLRLGKPMQRKKELIKPKGN